jgi:hypothetical protein
MFYIIIERGAYQVGNCLKCVRLWSVRAAFETISQVVSLYEEIMQDEMLFLIVLLRFSAFPSICSRIPGLSKQNNRRARFCRSIVITIR